VRPVLVLIFHATAPAGAGPLVRALAQARHSLASGQREAWLAAGADSAEIVEGPPDGLTFGERLRMAVEARPGGGGEMAGRGLSGAGGYVVLNLEMARPSLGGLVVVGSGSMPLARIADLRRFVDVAAGPAGHALANNRYSADAVAISRPADLAGLPPLPADNALPRWLEERAGLAVADLRSRWRLGVDVDTPLDLLVLDRALPQASARGLHAAARLIGGRPTPLGEARSPLIGEARSPLIGERLAALGEVLSNRRAEVLVAGRVSAATLQWLQRGVACRVRALIEERGLRAASRLAQSDPAGAPAAPPTSSRPPRSILGELLDRDGPEALAAAVARLADAAVIDTRVLMAHRHGAGESGWPGPEDRFASDLLQQESIADPWLSSLTASAVAAPSDHPILLGGHTLVNGGLRLLAERARAGAR
jgi:hypothetical protein